MEGREEKSEKRKIKRALNPVDLGGAKKPTLTGGAQEEKGRQTNERCK